MPCLPSLFLGGPLMLAALVSAVLPPNVGKASPAFR
ncbi:MAG: hypothetical protein QOG23_466 [Blastocatellia bacterium]|jgi:hypothetical protein|nr:hypothetical protein [Blastocatellia bacterium]